MKAKTWFLGILLVTVGLIVVACSGAAPGRRADFSSPHRLNPLKPKPLPLNPLLLKPPPREAAAAVPTEAPTVDPNVPTPEPTPVVNAFGQCSSPIRVWHGLTGSDGAVFAEMLQKFSEANPTVCFESQGIPWDLFFQKVSHRSRSRHTTGFGHLSCCRSQSNGISGSDAAAG